MTSSLQVNSVFCGALREAIEAAVAAGDNDLGGVDVGRIFLEGLFMLRAFESYCTRQVRHCNCDIASEETDAFLPLLLCSYCIDLGSVKPGLRESGFQYTFSCML